MDYRQLPDTIIEDEGNILFTHEEERNQAVDLVDTKSTGSGQNLLDLIDTMQAVDLGSSEDEGAESEGSGDENEEVGASGTFRGNSDAVVPETSSRGWYRPEQRRKCRRGRGGNKNKSRKGRARGKHHRNKENIADCAVTGDKDNKATNHTVGDKPVMAKNGSTSLNTAKGAIPKERGMPNKSQTTHAVRGQPTIVGNGSTPQATIVELPSLDRVRSSSYNSQRPTNRRSETTNSNNSPLDVELFCDRPRNCPRTQISRRRAAAARMRRHRDMDDYAIMLIMMTCPVSFLEFMLYSMARRRFWSDTDSD